MPAWTLIKESESTIVEPKSCPNCGNKFKIRYNPSTKVITNVDGEWDGLMNLRSAGGNMYRGECGLCQTTILLSNN